MFEIKIDSKDALSGLAGYEHSLRDMTPLARGISMEFLSHTEANFAAQGRPKWMGLKPSTIRQREKRGTWPGMIMQVTGQLAASYTPGHDSGSAWIGSNKAQAAIQNLGGDTGRGHKTKIEARPQLPMDAQGNLQPEAEDSILGLANNYLSSIGSR